MVIKYHLQKNGGVDITPGTKPIHQASQITETREQGVPLDFYDLTYSKVLLSNSDTAFEEGNASSMLQMNGQGWNMDISVCIVNKTRNMAKRGTLV